MAVSPRICTQVYPLYLLLGRINTLYHETANRVNKKVRFEIY